MLERVAITALIALAWTSTARAEDDTSLAQARRDVAASDYLAARTDLISALHAGTADPEQLAEIYKLSGTVEAALGNTSAATEAFQKWLALDAKAGFPAGTSPKITRPFDAAMKNRPGKLELKPETTDDPPRIALVIASDPLHLVTRARVFVSVDGKPEQTIEAKGGSNRIEVDLPRGKRLDIRVQALDSFGNLVATVGSRDLPIVLTPPDRSTTTPPPVADVSRGLKPEARGPSGRPLLLKWWLWTGVAVVLAGGATYFGLAARSDEDEVHRINADSVHHMFSEVVSVQDRANREAMAFNIGIIGAGAVAVFAGVLLATEPHARAETRVTAVPTSGGAALVLGGRF